MIKLIPDRRLHLLRKPDDGSKPGEYTKHYFVEGQRIMSKIGGGFANNPIELHLEPQEPPLEMNPKGEAIASNLIDLIECHDEQGQVDYEIDFTWMDDMLEMDEEENDQYFYHPDHLDSSSFISDASGYPHQHLEYLPFGEPYIEERVDWGIPYKFSGKELDY